MTQSKPSFSVTHFIPLIGPFIIGVDKLKDEFDIDEKYIFSFPPFENNQSHIGKNFPDKNIEYLPMELIPDYDGADWKDVTPYKDYIKEHNIESCDVTLAVPPCAGLSMLNASNRGADNTANRWMYETLKWHIAQDNNVMLLENAPGLVGKDGVQVMRIIESIMRANGVRDKYKIHTTKTTTLNHGLPQHRQRTFLYIYKSKEFVKFKNIKNKRVLLEDFFKQKLRSEEQIEGTDHVVSSVSWNERFFDWINEHDVWKDLRKLPGKYGNKSCAWYILDKYKTNPEMFVGHDKLIEKMDFYQSKLAKGMGFWDSTPMFNAGKVNAVIAKNAHSLIHPVYNRVLTVRELMDLMGYPDDFSLAGETLKNFNHICQSVPVNTGMDHIRWAQGIVNNDPKYIAGHINSKMDIILQNNMSGDLENNILAVGPTDEVFVKLKTEIKNKLKSFVN